MKIPFKQVFIIYALFLCTGWQSYAQSTWENKITINPMTLKTHYFQSYPKGTVRIYSGFEFRKAWEAPVSLLQGSLYRCLVTRFDFFISKHIWIQISGVLQEVLDITGRSAPGIFNNHSICAYDIGDYRIATIAYVIPPEKSRMAWGFRFETKMPNTEQKKELGLNTTDLWMSILASKPLGAVLLFAEAGMGILEAPRHLDEQNDVPEYGLGWIWQVKPSFQIAGEIHGYFSTHAHTPLGTESRGTFRLGFIWGSPRFTVEVFPLYGLNRREGTWGLSFGVHWKFKIGNKIEN